MPLAFLRHRSGAIVVLVCALPRPARDAAIPLSIAAQHERHF